VAGIHDRGNRGGDFVSRTQRGTQSPPSADESSPLSDALDTLDVAVDRILAITWRFEKVEGDEDVDALTIAAEALSQAADGVREALAQDMMARRRHRDSTEVP
jgi:hypothetical protein